MYELIIGNKNYSSWSMRPWVLMRALGIAFNERLLVFGATPDGEEFKRLSPSGRVPCLVDGALRVWDSLAIAEYLAERHPGVWPSESDPRAYARCAAAEMHSGFGALRNHCTMNVGVRIRLKELPAAVATDLARLQVIWEEGLQRFAGPFLAGARFTAADAFFAPVATRVQTYDLPVSATSRAYLERLLQVPAVKEWMDAGLKETWRDPPHEADAQGVGTLIQDLRAP